MLQNLVQKLKPGGRMVIPVGAQNSYQVGQCVAPLADMLPFSAAQQLVE